MLKPLLSGPVETNICETLFFLWWVPCPWTRNLLPHSWGKGEFVHDVHTQVFFTPGSATDPFTLDSCSFFTELDVISNRRVKPHMCVYCICCRLQTSHCILSFRCLKLLSNFFCIWMILHSFLLTLHWRYTVKVCHNKLLSTMYSSSLWATLLFTYLFLFWLYLRFDFMFKASFQSPFSNKYTTNCIILPFLIPNFPYLTTQTKQIHQMESFVKENLFSWPLVRNRYILWHFLD